MSEKNDAKPLKIKCKFITHHSSLSPLASMITPRLFLRLCAVGRRRFVAVILLTPLLFAASPAIAQEQLKVKNGCAYKTAVEGTEFYTFDPSDEARRIVGEICNALGVSQNFDLRASSVDNALATTDGNRRIILYSTVFLKKFNEDARTRWAAYSVMAHEVGHHFNGHDFSEENPAKRKVMELEADRFAGSVMRLLGASLDEAKAGIETFALDAEQKYHPPARARREAIATGWTQQQERLEKMGAAGATDPGAGLPRERDTDDDGIPDKNDACPDEFGRALTAGCPDADEDGVPDRDDACRYRKGPAAWNSCPDSDGDGIPDHEDQCPDKPGLLADKGCPPPDRDKDGVPDRADKCPDTPGLQRFQGCPDTDGDGVPDPDDKCPNEKGEAMYDGCRAPLSVPTRTDTQPDNMVLVTGGAFTLGCKKGNDKECYDAEKPAHSVTVNSFYIGKYEVTNAEFVKFLNAKGNQTEGGAEWIDLSGSYMKEKCRISKSGSIFTVEQDYENHPVTYVSWYGASAYCAWLSEQSGKKYRLPSEAEWEYAARGGVKSRHYRYSGSNTLADVGWVTNNSGGKTHPVGSLKANELEIYDMSGNAWEWCGDDWHNDYKGAPVDGSVWVDSPKRGSYRVIRGGSWYNYAQYCRAACRSYGGPVTRTSDVGFRLALPLQ